MTAYRDAEASLLARRDELRALRDEAAETRYVQRAGEIGFALGCLLASLAVALCNLGAFRYVDDLLELGPIYWLLGAIVPGAFVGRAVARARARRVLVMPDGLGLTEEMAWLERPVPLQSQVGTWLTWRLAVAPLRLVQVASLLSPLTWMPSKGSWAPMALGFLGLATLVLLVLVPLTALHGWFLQRAWRRDQAEDARLWMALFAAVLVLPMMAGVGELAIGLLPATIGYVVEASRLRKRWQTEA